MDYLDIKYLLAKKGYTLTQVARELELSGPQAIYPVLARKYISARVEKRVSEITGIPLATLFPDHYSLEPIPHAPALDDQPMMFRKQAD